MKFKIGEEFRPSEKLKSLYYTYFAAIVLVLILFGFVFFVPAMIFAFFWFASIFFLPGLLILLFIAWWIGKYFSTIVYKFTDSDITWRRGVWFKSTGIVPYNRITNIDIIQGPVSRHFGIASLKIQTAGYSAQHQASAEIRIEGVEKFEEMREMLMGFIRGKKPVAVETYESGSDVLQELVKIRKLLEKGKR